MSNVGVDLITFNRDDEKKIKKLDGGKGVPEQIFFRCKKKMKNNSRYCKYFKEKR
jgi:hypothetical protein